MYHVAELVYMSVEINLKMSPVWMYKKKKKKIVRLNHSIILQIANLRTFQCGHADTFIKCDY